MSRPSTNDEGLSKLYKQRGHHVKFDSHATTYSRPVTQAAVKVDKSSIVWRDFLNGVKRRKRLLNHIKSVAVDENDLSTSLKRLLMELRQLTLKVIEDALEIEYRSQFGEAKAPIRAGTAMQLPPLASFRGLEGKEDLYMLSDIIDDTSDLFQTPNIQTFLPLDFPVSRNPFILGKDVDGLAALEGPRPEPGNIAMELKALEFLRYKRAAKALLRAEAQVHNRMPLNLEDIEYLWRRLSVDRNDDVLVRTAITLMIPENTRPGDLGPELRHMIDETLQIQPPQFLYLLNNYPSEKVSYSLELLACIRHLLKDVSTTGFTDIASAYLYEWVKLVVGSDAFGTNAEEANAVTPPPPNKKKSRSKSPIKARGPSPSRQHQAYPPAVPPVTAPLQSGAQEDDVSSIESPSPPKTKQQHKTKNKSPGGKGSVNSVPGADRGTKATELPLQPPKGKKRRAAKGTGGDGNGASMETLNALKYEIIKMQQELLRRKILDPKAYGLVPAKLYGQTVLGATERTLEAEEQVKGASTSVAARVQGKKYDAPPEYMNVEEVDDMTNIRKELDPLHALVLLKEPMRVKVGACGQVEILVSSNKSTVFTQFRRPVYPDDSCQAEVDDLSMESSVATAASNIPEQVVTFSSLNKLLFDRLTGLQIDTVIEANDKTRHDQLAAFVTMIQQHLDRYVDPNVLRQHISFRLDLVIVREELTAGNIAVDVVMERSVDSPGLMIRAVPREGSLFSKEKMDNTPINMFLHDRELLVLLINQRGLYTLAMTKWSCLEMVARWVLGRLHINRIPFPIQDTSRILNVDNSGQRALVGSNGGGVKTYFEVKIDRSVHIIDEVKNYWNATNVPTLNDVRMKCLVSAHQELEMLHFTVVLELRYVPTAVMERRLKEKEAAREYRAKLVEFSTPYDDDHKGHRVIPNTWDVPFDTDEEVETNTLKFAFALTGNELLMFGAGESLDERKVHKKHDQTYQANLFMKNVMSRMSIVFKGTKSAPQDEAVHCKVDDNWELTYNRKLLRDVRTVTGGIMVITANGYGDEILFESKPTDHTVFKAVGAKLFAPLELEEIANSEGWSLDVLEPENRVILAHRIAEKLKVILHEDKHRLEFYTYPETRMLEVVTQATINKPETCIGVVEINSLITLNELRVVINHELDRDQIPKLYRFIYKNGPCSLKQEPFRKAWECLPRCMLMCKTTREIHRSADTIDKSKEAVEKALAKAKKADEQAKTTSLSGKKLVPIPIPTLCKAQEGVYCIHTRHDMRDTLHPGDILRIGHIESSDFAIPFSFARVLEFSREGAEQSGGGNTEDSMPVKIIPIDPYFLTYGEADLFVSGNMPFSRIPVPTPREEDITVDVDENGNHVVKQAPTVDPESLIDVKFQYLDEIATREEQTRLANELKGVANESGGGTGLGSEAEADVTNSSLALRKQEPDFAVASTNLRNDMKELQAASVRKERQKAAAKSPGKVFRDLWIWKCIPRSEDNRPKWRRQYDDGEIKYSWTYRDHIENPVLFSVSVPLRLMEEFVRDVRCADMTMYSQRVDQVPRIGIDYYTELAYEHIVNLHPASVTKGIDETKFKAFIKFLNVFPDFHKVQRQTQLSTIYFREVNGPQGDNSFVNYYGFCNLIQEVCLIRYPAGMFDLDGPEAPENNVYAAPGTGPPAPPSDIDRGGDDVDNQSIRSMGSSDGSILSRQSAIPLSAAAKRATVLPVASVDKMKRGGKKKGGSRKSKLMAHESTFLSQVDPKHAAIAYRKFVTDYFISLPVVLEGIWEQAKVLAMEKEALRYAAATRICTSWRRGRDRFRFQQFKYGMIELQSYARRKQFRRRVAKIMKLYTEDWLFRIRYHSSILIQSSVRRYLERCRFLKKTAKIRERELIVAKAKRQRSSKLRQRERKGIVFKQIRRVNGVMAMLLLKRKDQRNYSNDYGMRLEVYNPQFQLVNVFIIDEADLRKYMQDILHVNTLSVGDLLNKKNLEKVISVRLLCRLSKRVGDPPKMILSRQALGQKGPKVMTRGRNIQGEMFACTLFETGYDIVVQCYHQRTCIIFPCIILISALTEWVTEEYIKTCSNDIEKQLQPPMLRTENKTQLHHWLINNIVVDKRRGKFQVMFQVQLNKSMKMDAIILIQSVFRMALARSKVPAMVDQYLLKVQNSIHDAYDAYYINIYTGVSDWAKSPLLKPHQDLPTLPYYRWVQLLYSEQPLFVNPLTGKYTFFTPDRAARMIQSMVRNWMLKPFKLSFDAYQKGVAFEKEAQHSYDREPKRLAFVLNYALMAFCVLLDYKLTRRLITEALELADTNPLATRLHAIFLLSTCEAPTAASRAEAMGLLQDATRRDPQCLKFSGALNFFFKYACYRQPRHCHTLLNLGLAEYYVFKNMANAEVCLRRAVAISPFDPHVMDNWMHLRDNFPEKKLVYRPRGRLHKISNEQGGKRTTIHGRPVVENPAWAGWVFVERDAMFKDEEAEYWYNPGTGQSQKHMPEDWHHEWELRAYRSVFEGEKGGLEFYFDQGTATYFQRHILTDTYQ